MIKILRENYISIIFFTIFLILGHIIYKDYLVTPDETLHRENGFISLKYIINLFSINFDLTEIHTIPDLYNDWRKTYGVLFDLPLSLIETVLKLNIQETFLLRHYLTFLIFFVANIYFFLLLKKNLFSKNLALLGVVILVSTPRIFSHSFYNSKDILFLSLMIIATFYSLELLKKYSLKILILSSLFCALASNIRIIGIYLPLLTFIFYFFKENKNKPLINLEFFIKYFFIFFLVLYIIWPFLWQNPIQNFFLILSESTNYPNHWNFNILYLGKYFNPENLPWHYFFVWFFSTTPLFFLIIIISGVLIFLRGYLLFFLNLKFSKDIQIWKNLDQMKILFIFLGFFVPIFFVVCLNSTLYNGWRHLFFLYPFLIFIGIYGADFILRKSNNNLKYLIYFFFIIQISSNLIFIYKAHPVQNIYFNIISKPFVYNYLPIDYWGLGNKKTIDYIIDKKNTFSISSSSFTPLENIRFSKKKNYSYSNNIKFYGTQKKFKKFQILYLQTITITKILKIWKNFKYPKVTPVIIS